MDTELQPLFTRHSDILTQFSDEADAIMLTLFIMKERGKNESSFWAPFLKAMPKEFDNLTVWSSKELAQFCDYELEADVEKLKEKQDKLWDTIHPIILEYSFLFPQHHRSHWQLAYDQVNSRCIDYGMPSTMLVPVADLMNHIAGVDTSIAAFNLDHISDDNSIDYRICVDQEVKDPLLRTKLKGYNNAAQPQLTTHLSGNLSDYANLAEGCKTLKREAKVKRIKQLFFKDLFNRDDDKKQEELLSVWNQGYESSDCDEDSDGPQNQGEYYDEEADYDNEDYGAEQADKNDGEEDVDALIS